MSMLSVKSSLQMKIDIFGRQVGADAGEESAQIRAGPPPDVIPAFHTDVADDLFLLRQLVNLLRGPRALVLDQAGQF
jgi:hypothetical protein